jgi:hypothetical protein
MKQIWKLACEKISKFLSSIFVQKGKKQHDDLVEHVFSKRRKICLPNS